ncbi:hypothetical protein Leryth_003017 [Lithospermum erythrorhizon]|nr:hypothetical protein Leryth_003017 [Lithospermum erythrorhizon]
MQRIQHCPRINITELKEQIVRRLGPERSKQYFYYLNRLLSLKLNKVEFNQLCVRIVGRDNIPLHNQFIRSILKNACSAKTPPPAHDSTVVKQTSSSPGFSNGDISLHSQVSPRKARTNRRGGDRLSVLGQNGKIDSASQQLQTSYSRDPTLDSGSLSLHDTQRSAEHHRGRENFSYQVSKCSNINKSLDGPVSVHRKEQRVSSVREDDREMHARGSLQAPLGIPFCAVSVGGARRSSSLSFSSKCISASSWGGLLDSVTLRESMEQIARTQGLEGVSIDSANLLNNGLNSYLKGIIGSCIGHVGSRFGHEREKNTTKQKNYPKLVNGMKTNHQFQMQPSGRPSDCFHENKPSCPISMQDLRVSMELNPQQLGEDWPVLLEKICIQSFDE